MNALGRSAADYGTQNKLASREDAAPTRPTQASQNGVAISTEDSSQIKSEFSAIQKQAAIDASTILAKKLELQIISENIGPNPFVIEAHKVSNILRLTNLTHEKLLQELIPIAKPLARPPISTYYVGAAALGKSGNIYLGVNLEFKGFPLNQAVHGEQFLIANARIHGETELIAIAVSAAPCGHCRQFLNEMGAVQTQILIPNHPPKSLSQFLPEAFGPQDLGLTGGLLTSVDYYKSQHPCSLTARAIDAALSSYAPYSKSLSGLALRVKDGTIYSGSYMENAAFNPSLSPLQSALVALVADKRDYDEICEAILVEQKSAVISHASISEEILKSLAPKAKFKLESMP